MKNSSFVTSTAGGTLCSILPVVSSGDVLKTIILAALGTVVSFIVTLLINRYGKKGE